MQVQIVSDNGELLWRLTAIEDFNLNKPIAREVLSAELLDALGRIQDNPDYKWIE